MKINNKTFLIAVKYACEALIACTAKIDVLDKLSTDKEFNKCGTRLANTAAIIRSAISKNQFIGLSLSNTIFQIASIFGENIQDPQSELYMIFFNSIGKAIEDQEYSETIDWIDAYIKAIDSVDKIVKGTKFSDTLFAAKISFCNAYANDKNIPIIYALEQAVNAAQNQTAHIILDSGRISKNMLKDNDYGYSELAGAHAIGIWMRGAFEGIKLKYLNQIHEDKCVHLNLSNSDDVMIISKNTKS